MTPQTEYVSMLFVSHFLRSAPVLQAFSRTARRVLNVNYNLRGSGTRLVLILNASISHGLILLQCCGMACPLELGGVRPWPSSSARCIRV